MFASVPLWSLTATSLSESVVKELSFISPVTAGRYDVRDSFSGEDTSLSTSSTSGSGNSISGSTATSGMRTGSESASELSSSSLLISGESLSFSFASLSSKTCPTVGICTSVAGS